MSCAPPPTTGTRRRVTWHASVADTTMKRSCGCMCCSGCGTNSSCGAFGEFKCAQCTEWRCGKCVVLIVGCAEACIGASAQCKYCLRIR